jgi:hypothetical protein
MSRTELNKGRRGYMGTIPVSAGCMSRSAGEVADVAAEARTPEAVGVWVARGEEKPHVATSGQGESPTEKL